MIEIVNIIFLILTMIWISCFPIVKESLNINLLKYKITKLEKITINLSILINFLLIFSFYNIDQKYIFIAFLFFPLINLIYLNKSLKLEEYYFLFFFTFVLSVTISSNLTLEWDGAAVWIYRTLNFVSENNFKNLSEVPGDISYPHLGSYLWAFFWKNSIFHGEYVGRIFFIYSFCLSILILINSVKINLFKKILLSITFFIISLDYYLFSGYQEYLVFSFLICIFYFYFKYVDKKNFLFLVPVFLFMNATIWVKNEATFFILFFLLFVYFDNFINKRKIDRNILLLSIFYITIVLIKYYIFYENFYVINKGWVDYEVNSFEKLFHSGYFFERLIAIIKAIFVALIKCKIFLIFFLTIIFFSNKKNFNIFLPFLFFLILNLLLIFLIYYLSNSSSWDYFLATTVDRLIFQVSGVFLLPIIYFLNKNFNLKNN